MSSNSNRFLEAIVFSKKGKPQLWYCYSLLNCYAFWLVFFSSFKKTSAHVFDSWTMREANSIVPNVLKINVIIIVCSWKPQLYENHRFVLPFSFTCLGTQTPNKNWIGFFFAILLFQEKILLKYSKLNRLNCKWVRFYDFSLSLSWKTNGTKCLHVDRSWPRADDVSLWADGIQHPNHNFQPAMLISK